MSFEEPLDAIIGEPVAEPEMKTRSSSSGGKSKASLLEQSHQRAIVLCALVMGRMRHRRTGFGICFGERG